MRKYFIWDNWPNNDLIFEDNVKLGELFAIIFDPSTFIKKLNYKFIIYCNFSIKNVYKLILSSVMNLKNK